MTSTVVRFTRTIYDFSMPAEVYSSAKPAAPFRAWIVALLLLIVASALAADLAHRGSGTWTAADLVHPQNWDIAFRPPQQFVEVDVAPNLFGSVYAYRFTDKLDRNIELTIWRKNVENSTASHMARYILEKSKSWLSLLVGPPVTRTEGRMGNHDAIEILDGSIPMVMRVTALENGWGYAVCLRVEGGPIDESLYVLFDMTCRSVQFQSPNPQ